MPTKPRILLYSHDTYGLGHLRRSLSVAGQIARDIPNAHQLLVTGSMVAGAFGLPPRLDMVKLPALSKRSSGKYKARALPLTLKRTLAWREQMILQAAINFQPHLLLVDKVAGGVHGELLPTLRHLKAWSSDTKIVLGMRDIEDSPTATQAEWAKNKIPQLLDKVYDAILLYGQRAVFDPLSAYNMSPSAAGKVIECGYLRRALSPDVTLRSSKAVRRELLGYGYKPLVLVTVGGGGDGYEIIKTYMEMLAGQSDDVPYHSVIVTGPLMAEGKRKQLRQAARDKPVTFFEFTPDLVSYMAAADLVVSMAGYNTVCEILSLQKRALLIPRMRVRAEQALRAMRLAERGLAQVLLPTELTPQRLATQIECALSAPPPPATLDLDGLPRVSAAIADLLNQK
ncbi:MAG: glycosyltransferase family protein [Ardenticatenaceae bacterium]